jgi:hypothetical protein
MKSRWVGEFTSRLRYKLYCSWPCCICVQHKYYFLKYQKSCCAFYGQNPRFLVNESIILVHIRLKERNSKRPTLFCCRLIWLNPSSPATFLTLLPKLSSSLSSLMCGRWSLSMQADKRRWLEPKKTTEKSIGHHVYIFPEQLPWFWTSIPWSN